MITCTLTDIELINRVGLELDKMIETGGKSFTMRVPAQVNSDTDLLLSELLTRFKTSKKAASNVSDVSHRLLSELRKCYLVEVDENGHPKSDMTKILKLWDDVNKELLVNHFVNGA